MSVWECGRQTRQASIGGLIPLSPLRLGVGLHGEVSEPERSYWPDHVWAVLRGLGSHVRRRRVGGGGEPDEQLALLQRCVPARPALDYRVTNLFDTAKVDQNEPTKMKMSRPKLKWSDENQNELKIPLTHPPISGACIQNLESLEGIFARKP